MGSSCRTCGRPSNAEARAEIGERLALAIQYDKLLYDRIQSSLRNLVDTLVLPLCAVPTCGHVEDVHDSVNEYVDSVDGGHDRTVLHYCRSCTIETFGLEEGLKRRQHGFVARKKDGSPPLSIRQQAYRRGG